MPFATRHDSIPDFGEQATIRSIQHGDWDDPHTWDIQRIPEATDIVSITHAVQAAERATCKVAAVYTNGHLWFAPEQSSQLTLETLLIAPGGSLVVGLPNAPIQNGYEVHLAFSGTLDPATDPDEYGLGLVVIDGSVSIHGAPRGQSYIRLAQPLRAIAKTLPVGQPVPSEWQIGDHILLPDSRQPTGKTISVMDNYEYQTITSINGNLIDIGGQLLYHHPGAYDSLTGQLDFTPHVANITRNVTLETAHGSPRRGHTFFTGRSTVDIQNGCFRNLGRTTTAPTGPGNHIGRYPLHLHHMYGPPPNPQNAHQFAVTGNVVMNDGPFPPNNERWGIVLHDSHYGRVANNILHKIVGAAILTEDGSEYMNVIEHNFICQVTGSGDRMGMGNEATGIWCRGGQSIVRNNVVCNVLGTAPGQQHCGYSVFQQYTGDHGNVMTPNFPGADPHHDGTLVNLYSTPLKEFADNEVYSSCAGVTMWWIGCEYTAPRTDQESFVSGLQTWNLYSSHWVHYHTHNLTIARWKARGTPLLGEPHNMLYYGADYFMSGWLLEDCDLQGTQDGVMLSTDTQGEQCVADCLIAVAGSGIIMQSLWTSSYTPKDLKPRAVCLNNSVVKPIPGSQFMAIDMQYRLHGAVTLVRRDELSVMRYQGQKGNDFNVLYPQQEASFVVPQTILNSDGTPQLEGAPDAGLTNAEAWDKYGIAIAGRVAKAGYSMLPEITGLVERASTPPPPTDTEPPSRPTNLHAVAETTTIALRWDASTDNVGVTGYTVHLPTLAVLETQITALLIESLSPDTEYVIAVVAHDAAGNHSAPARITVRTKPLPAAWEPEASQTGVWGMPDGTEVQATAVGPSAIAILKRINELF